MSALLGGMFFVGSVAPAYAEIVNKYNKTVVVTYSVLIGASTKTRTFLLKPNEVQRTDLGGNGSFKTGLVAEWNPKAMVDTGVARIKLPAMSKLGRGAPGKTLGTIEGPERSRLRWHTGLNYKFTIGSDGQVKKKLLNPQR